MPKNRPIPIACISVAIPATSRSALASSAIVAASSFSALPTTSGTATESAYMIDMCCKPSKVSFGTCGNAKELAGNDGSASLA